MTDKTNVDCPICGAQLDATIVKMVGLDPASAEMLHEKAHTGKLVSLVQLGSIAENYLKPEMLSLPSARHNGPTRRTTSTALISAASVANSE